MSTSRCRQTEVSAVAVVVRAGVTSLLTGRVEDEDVQHELQLALRTHPRQGSSRPHSDPFTACFQHKRSPASRLTCSTTVRLTPVRLSARSMLRRLKSVQ